MDTKRVSGRPPLRLDPTPGPRQIPQAYPPVANTIDQAGKRLGVSRSTVYRMIRSGQVGYIQLGDRRFIPEAELQRLVSGPIIRAS